MNFYSYQSVKIIYVILQTLLYAETIGRLFLLSNKKKKETSACMVFIIHVTFKRFLTSRKSRSCQYGNAFNSCIIKFLKGKQMWTQKTTMVSDVTLSLLVQSLHLFMYTNLYLQKLSFTQNILYVRHCLDEEFYSKVHLRIETAVTGYM